MKTNLLPCIGLLAALSAVPAAGEVYYVAEGADAQAIQDALWCVAMDVATNAEPGEVVVPAGNYVLSEALRIYPGTTLTLEEGAAVRYVGANGGFMLLGSHLDENGQPCSGDGCSHGGYSQCHDVVVQGGSWDRNASPSDDVGQAFLFRHASGITIRNLSVANCTSHHINLAGSENTVVENVSFSGRVEYTGDSETFWGVWTPGDPGRYASIEAVHLDYLDELGEAGARPLDQTPARNVLVTNCTFDAVFAGVGVHHLPLGDSASDIQVVDCYFHNLFSYPSYLFGVEGATVENNIVEGGQGLLYSSHSSFRAIGNDLSGLTKEGVYICNGSTATISGNVFENTGLRAILACEGSVVTATQNTVRKTGDHAILLMGCGTSVVDGNTVSDAGAIGILAMDGTRLYARNNTIVSPGTHGLFSTGGSTLVAGNNTIRSAGGNGIAADGGTANLSNNRIVSPGIHGIFGYNSAKVTATSNTIESPAKCGFSFQSKAKLTTSGKNVVKNPKSQGVLLSGAAASTISGMQITGSGSDGIRLVLSPGCTVSGNTISGVKDKKAGIVLEQCRSGTVTGNTITGSTGHGIRIFGTKSVPSTATVSKNKSTGAAAPYLDIILGDWSRNCKVLDNTLGRKRFTISSVGTAGNTFRPVGTSLTKVAKKGKTAMVARWTAQPQAGGFEVQYCPSKKFPASKSKSVSVGAGKTAKTVKGLVAGKKYWVRIRTFHKVGAKKYYSSWSAAKAVKL